jgi:hypothetical protein
MLLYRLLFSWLFSFILNCFAPMAADESMLNADRTPAVDQEQIGYNDDPKRNRKAKA